MKGIRGVHLYLGLLLLPWVLLYGATAVLFNHSTWLSNPVESRFAADVLTGTALAPFDPTLLGSDIDDAVASATISNLEAKSPEVVVTSRELSGGFDFRVTSPDARHRVWIGAEGESVRVWTTPRRKETSKAIEIPRGTRLAALDRYVANAEAGFDELRGCIGLPSGDVELRRSPSARFDLIHDGDRFRAEYDPRTGRFSVSAADDRTLGLRSSLLRLHTAHGYPSELGARLVWAIVVDVMGLAMILWGASGVLMWWQLLRTRFVGSVCLAISAVSAGWLAWAMLQEIAR